MSKTRFSSTTLRRPTLLRKTLSVTILSEGTILPSQLGILKIQTLNHVNQIPVALVEIQDPDFLLSQSEEFTPGSEWEIKAGYNSNEDLIFKGAVLSHRFYPSENGNVIQVQLKDSVYQMDSGPASRMFHDLSEKDIAESIIGDYPIDIESVEGMELTHDTLIQFDQTDWSFLVDRAKNNGCFVAVSNGKININRVINGSVAVSELTPQKANNYDLSLDAEFQTEELKGKVWSIQDQEMTESSIRSKDKIQVQMAKFLESDESSVGNDPYLTEEELDQSLVSELAGKWLNKIRGFVEVASTSSVRSGDNLKLDGFGKYLEKDVFVSGVEHEIIEGEWTSTIHIGLDLEEYYEEGSSFTGLHIGIVKEVEGGDNHQIKVNIPAVEENSDGVWARLALPGAGKDKGLLFRPEIGDEVIVSFLGSSLQNPIILGGLHSDSNYSPISDQEGEDVKGFYTREGLKLTLDDDEKKIELVTPEGNKVFISSGDGVVLEDEGGNSLKLDSNGITISSQSDLNLSATGDINLNGTNIHLNADAEASIHGGSKAELKSNATTSVEGSLVQIN